MENEAQDQALLAVRLLRLVVERWEAVRARGDVSMESSSDGSGGADVRFWAIK